MSEIKRTGPPTASDVKGRMITWTLPLSAMPDKEWRQFFLQTKDTTLTCNPRNVHIYQGLMVFDSVEEDVPAWITFIDKWMAAANSRHAEWEATQRRPRGEPGAVRDRDRTLRELSEKFKNL